MPKYHLLEIGTNPIDPKEIKQKFKEHADLDVDVKVKKGRAYVTVDTGDGVARTFKQLLALVPPEYDDHLEELENDVRLVNIGPINLDDLGSQESAE